MTIKGHQRNQNFALIPAFTTEKQSIELFIPDCYILVNANQIDNISKFVGEFYHFFMNNHNELYRPESFTKQCIHGLPLDKCEYSKIFESRSCLTSSQFQINFLTINLKSLNIQVIETDSFLICLNCSDLKYLQRDDYHSNKDEMALTALSFDKVSLQIYKVILF